jgi:hypothetical protein
LCLIFSFTFNFTFTFFLGFVCSFPLLVGAMIVVSIPRKY